MARYSFYPRRHWQGKKEAMTSVPARREDG